MWQTAKLATMGELAASIAHELNNPLGTVSLAWSRCSRRRRQTVPSGAR
jgi:C4-dicarboxylate-specific signal transduction histidine kinase